MILIRDIEAPCGKLRGMRSFPDSLSQNYFFLLFGFFTSFFAPCRDCAMCHHLFRLFVSTARDTSARTFPSLRQSLSLFRFFLCRRWGLNLVLCGLRGVFFQFALLFFLILLLLCYFSLSLLKIKIWFCQGTAPYQKIFPAPVATYDPYTISRPARA